MPPTLPPPTIPPTLPPPTIPPTLPPPATTPSDPCIPGVTCPPSDAGNCIAHPDCPSVNGPTVTLLPHANCPMFYKCNNGLACEMNCPAGLHFNPLVDSCDWPSNACCDPTSPVLRTIPEIVSWILDNCYMFYKCDNGKACEHNCPAGLHFNPQLDVCDWPSNACCDPTVPCNPPCIPGVTCPPTGPTPNCYMFYKCDNGKACEHNCPAGLHFNPQLDVCDWPSNACCDPTVPSVPTILPHTNCNMFYKCNNGKACEQNCPAGLHFNAQLSVCDWPSNACCDPTVPCNPPCIPGVTSVPTILPHTNCNMFYKCNNGKACEQNCPAGLHFNAQLSVCDWPSNACCDPTVPCNPPCIPGPTLFAHSACDKFYKCSNRKACEHLCPPGLHFNALQFVCDWPGSAIVGRMFA
uniref:Chitin-binding type-2 domain-containing protein n=1 Tax=Anopheles atroparvus TaxID=41427 RepID=A0AAG5DLT4_ANOAO